MSEAWDQAYAQATGTDVSQPTPQQDEQATADQTAQTQQPTKQTRRTYDKGTIAREADSQANGGESHSLGDYAWDAGVGVAAGAESFAKSIGKLGNDVAGVFGHKFTDDSTFDSSIHTKTWLGALTSGATQFALAFIPALGVAGKVGSAIGVTSKLATGLAAGAAADFFGFSEKQDRLSNLIQSVPALKNPVTDFLQSKDDDNFAVGRLKNALEGIGLGAALHPLFESLKGFKGMLEAHVAGDGAAVAAKSAETSEKVAAAMGDLQKQAQTGMVPGNPSQSLGKDAKDYIRGMDMDDTARKIVDQIKANPDKPFEVGLDEAVQTHVNYDRLVTSKDVEGLQKLAQGVADKYVQSTVGGSLNLDVVKNTADELAETFGENPNALFASLSRDEKGVQGVATRLVSYRIMRNSLGQSLVNSANRWLAAGSSGVADTASEELNKLTMLSKSYMEIHKSVQFIQTEGARIPSFGRVLADSVDNFDPDKLVATLDKVMKGGSGTLAKEQLARTIVASNGDPKSMLTLFDGMMNKSAGKVSGVLNEIHTNAILSSMTTMSTKFLSDLTNAVVLPAERMLGGAFMQNKAVVQSGGRMYQNIIQSLMDWTHLSSSASKISDAQGSSMGRAFHAFISGQPVLDGMSEFKPQNAISAATLGGEGTWLGSAVNMIGKITNLPHKMLLGMDELWGQVNYRAYVRDEAYRLAEQQGLKGDAYATFVNGHISDAFGKMGQGSNEAALNYSKAARFQNDLLPGTMGKWMQDGVNQHPLLRMINPFVKTPANIFRRAFQMTPGLNMLQQEFRNMAMSADPLERAQAYGRTALGGAVWTTAIGMAQMGKITGGGPSNPEEAQALKASGWQPYSIVSQDDQGNKTYISLKKLEPFAYMLGIAADWKDAIGQTHDDDAEHTGTAMVYALAHHLSSKAYFEGITEVVNALASPDRQIERVIQNFAGSWVPAGLAKMNDDPYMREAKDMMDAMRRRVPGLSKDMPPVRNILGEPVQVPAGYLPFGADGSSAARQLSPFAMSKSINDPAHQELANLQYGFQKAPKSFQGFDLSNFHSKDGQDAYDRLQELSGSTKIGGQTMGDAINKMVTSKRYQELDAPDRHGDDTNPRVQAVRGVIAAFRQQSMRQVIGEYPQIGQAIQSYRTQNRSASTPSPILSALAQK